MPKRSALYVFIFLLFSSVGSSQTHPELKEAVLCSQDADAQSVLIEEAEQKGFVVRRVEFVGNETIRDREYRKRIRGVDPGDVFSERGLINAIQSAERIKGIYPITARNVRIALDLDSRSVDLVFCVKEKLKKN